MPLTFDLPLEELKEYQGRNPRPSDFDAFWEQSLAEMQALDPQVELRPSDFQPPLPNASIYISAGLAVRGCMPNCYGRARRRSRIRRC